MILKDIYFFEETNQIGDSKILINENKGDMLSLQVNCEGNFNFEVQGCIDILSDTYNKVFATNMLTSERQENITSNGIYQIDIDGYRKIKLVLNSIGSQPITVYGVMKEENGDIDIEDDIATKDYVNAAISGKEDASNKVTSIDNDSTDVQYPSAKAVYDLYQNAGQTLLIGDISNLTTSSTTQQIYDAFGSEEIFNSFLDYTKNSKPIYMHFSYEYVFDGRYTDTIPIIKTLYDKYPGQNNGQVSIIFPNMSTDTKEMFTYYHMVIGFSSNVPSIVSIEKLNSLEAYIINPAIDSLASESTSSDISNVINLGEILKLTSGSDINGDYILNMYSPVFKFSDNTYNPAVLYNIIGISVDNFAYMSGGYNFIIQYMKGSDKLVTLTLYSNSRGEANSYAFVSKTEVTLGGDTTQYSTMPTANADTLGEIVQYIGVTTNNYVNGYFYKCVSDGAGTPNYSWENINVQASSSIVSIDYSSIYSLTESSTSEQIIAAFGGADKVEEVINAAKEGKLFLGTSEVPGTITTGIDTSMLVQVFYKQHDWSGEDTLTLYFIPSITSQYYYGENLTKLNSLKIKKCRFDRDRDNGEMYCLEAREIGFIDSLYMISTEVDELTTSSTSVEISAIINLPNIIGQETGAWAMQINHKTYAFNAGELQSNYYFIGLSIQNLNPPFFDGDIRVKLSYIAPTNKLTTLVLNYNETSGLSSVISKNIIELDNLENSSNKVTSLSSNSTDTQYPSAKCVYDNLITKQDLLVSGTNIKTINNQSILGSGNITISGGSSSPYIYTGTNTADDIEAFKSIIDEYNQTGKWDLDYIIYKNTTVMSDVQIRMNEATLLSATSYVKSYRFIFKGDYQAYNTQYNTTLYGKATVVWLNGDYSINFEVETVDNIAPLDNNLQYDRKVLTTDNTTSFTPTNDYHPATKKYVDDCTSSKLNTSKIKNTNSTTAGDVYDVRYVNSVLGDISTVLASLVTVGGGN